MCNYKSTGGQTKTSASVDASAHSRISRPTRLVPTIQEGESSTHSCHLPVRALGGRGLRSQKFGCILIQGLLHHSVLCSCAVTATWASVCIDQCPCSASVPHHLLTLANARSGCRVRTVSAIRSCAPLSSAQIHGGKELHQARPLAVG